MTDSELDHLLTLAERSLDRMRIRHAEAAKHDGEELRCLVAQLSDLVDQLRADRESRKTLV